ncbi:MAG: hypothetical protein IJ745_04600 [Bacteroidales bacterium]|nr:hypothetical protein [Bacteroidales bacterium]
MGVALMACSLFMACGSDSDDNDSTATSGNSVKVTFGDTQWTATKGLLYTGTDGNELRIFQTENEMPFFGLMFNATPGSYRGEASLQNSSSGEYTYYSWTNEDISNLSYAEEDYFQGGGNIYTGEWKPVTAQLTITAFDANALTASMTLVSHMYNYKMWYQDDVTNAEDAPTKDLKAEINNYQFTQWD